MVSGSDDATLRVWDPRRVCLRLLEGHTSPVCCVSVTPNGRRAVSGSDDATLRVWDLESGHCVHTLEGRMGEVWSVSVTADGRRAVSASTDKTLRIWDLESGRCLRTLKGHSGGVERERVGRPAGGVGRYRQDVVDVGSGERAMPGCQPLADADYGGRAILGA